jgi:hypothetical protein
VIHLIVEHARDLTNDLWIVSGLDAPFPASADRREAKHGGSGVDSSDPKPPINRRPRDIE